MFLLSFPLSPCPSPIWIYFLHPSRNSLPFIAPSSLPSSLELILVFSMLSSPRFLPSSIISAFWGPILSFYFPCWAFKERASLARLFSALWVRGYELPWPLISSFEREYLS